MEQNNTVSLKLMKYPIDIDATALGQDMASLKSCLLSGEENVWTNNRLMPYNFVTFRVIA